ncbi:hypothetical protein AAG570_001704 [Ranatra chinensis]|uniref:Uncharacterized protein n=1 Tax=Ranatra chinensis TaxID=642074 RepID=A0ABD0YB85_9HEMI
MTHLLFWKGARKLTVLTPDGCPDEFLKSVGGGRTIFLLDDDGQVWRGEIDDEAEEIVLRKTGVKGMDLAVMEGKLYVVNEMGRVYRYGEEVDESEEVIVHEEANSCIHGYTTTSHRVTIRRISGGATGMLFLSDRGELWASGDHPHLDISPNDPPKKVMFFSGQHVTHIASGGDFHAVVAHRRDDGCPMNSTDPGSGDPEVFLSNCPNCNSAVSPLSPQSYSDTCPLGLQLKKSNESLSASTSSTSKNNDEDSLLKKSDNGNTSSSTEADSYRASDCNRVEAPQADSNAEKGDKVTLLLINTEAARQFLTRQLSWMSSGGEELLAEVSVPTRIIRQNVSNMASLVYEGVKTVGDKVATLSRHMSGGSDNNSESFEEFEELNRSNASFNSFRYFDYILPCLY